MNTVPPKNPYRPGAGHQPPFLAGRQGETNEFEKLLEQELILENMVLTGLRGVGKTVLLDTWKPIAIQKNWKWVGSDLSETASLSEVNLATRILVDLSVVTSTIPIKISQNQKAGFIRNTETSVSFLSYEVLAEMFDNVPGLVADKLKEILEFVWDCMTSMQDRPQGLVIAYDEAQNLSDQSAKEEYPMSVLLDVFQSIQKKGIPFMLVLTGLPTLFPKLIEARTYAERMFRVVLLDRLDKTASRDAIVEPCKADEYPFRPSDATIDTIYNLSAGYPYFIQFICREVYDVWLQQASDGKEPSVPIDEIIRKLDTDFFAGRWSRATDRQRDLLYVIANLETCDDEFTVQEVVDMSKKLLDNAFSGSHVSQMLLKLSDVGLVYKNRHGKYSFAVPLFGRFILRQRNHSL